MPTQKGDGAIPLVRSAVLLFFSISIAAVNQRYVITLSQQCAGLNDYMLIFGISYCMIRHAEKGYDFKKQSAS